MPMTTEVLNRRAQFKAAVGAKLRGDEVWYSEPEPAESVALGEPVRITRIDMSFLDLLNLVFKLALAQAIIAAPIALVLYFLLR